MILSKVHEIDGEKIVAVCDAGLLGKRFEERDMQIDLTGSFYKGEKTDEEQLDEIFNGAYIIDVVGEESVGIALEKGLIEKEGVIKVLGVPHAQVFSI